MLAVRIVLAKVIQNVVIVRRKLLSLNQKRKILMLMDVSVAGVRTGYLWQNQMIKMMASVYAGDVHIDRRFII
jgi:hypothetical protein